MKINIKKFFNKKNNLYLLGLVILILVLSTALFFGYKYVQKEKKTQ